MKTIMRLLGRLVKHVRLMFLTGLLIFHTDAMAYYYGPTSYSIVDNVEYRYYVNNGKAVIVEIYDYYYYGYGNGATLKIPPMLNDYSVVRIEEGAIYGGRANYYAAIELPEGLEEIGAGVFQSASGVLSITIPSTLKMVERNAFRGMGNSSGVDLLVVKISDLSSWTKIIFEDVPFSVAYTLYLGNMPLTHISIPDGTSEIRDFVFNGCTTIQSVSFPPSIESIAATAFEGCKNLKNI